MHELEIMPVQMEWMLPCVVVVDDNLDNLLVGQDEGVCIDSVYSWVCSEVTCAKGSVERGNFRVHISDIVEEGVVGTVGEIVHGNIQAYGVIRAREQLFVVNWNQEKVVQRCEFVNRGRGRPWGIIVVHEPASNIRIQAFRNFIKEVLLLIPLFVRTHPGLKKKRNCQLTSSILPTNA